MDVEEAKLYKEPCTKFLKEHGRLKMVSEKLLLRSP